MSNRSLATSRVTTQRGKDQAVGNGDIVVEDIDELNRYMHPDDAETGDENDDQGGEEEEGDEVAPKRKTKKGKKKNRTHRKPKLKHWEILALEQSNQQTCNCRHHVMRLAADQIVYDWCRCKDHQHKELVEKHKPPTPPPEPPRDPTPPPPPKPKPKPKPPKVKKKSVGINATEPTTTELALAYDPAAVDYDMIQEAIYYRTSSGRLVRQVFCLMSAMAFGSI